MTSSVLLVCDVCLQSLIMFASSSTSGLPPASRDLMMARMRENALCAGAVAVDYSVPATGPVATPFYPYGRKSPPSCSSGDDESCGSGGSLSRLTSRDALRGCYGDETLTETSAAAAGGGSSGAAAAMMLERGCDELGRVDGPDVDVSAAEFDDDDDDDRQRRSSSTPVTHRKHKAQKQVPLHSALHRHGLVFMARLEQRLLTPFVIHSS